jgi:hypothetical protein
MFMEDTKFLAVSQRSDRKFKDTFFRTLFHEEERALELCNAVDGTNYPKGTPLQFFSQGDKSLTRRNNDLAVVINNQLLSLKDHQGTINQNMPLRFLPFTTDILYTWLKDKKQLYKNKLVTIPTPKFYVLYNGKDKLKHDVLKLSDAFRFSDHNFSMELIVKVIDINYSKDNIILQKSPSLGGYSYLTEQIREHMNTGTPRDKAITEAVIHCIEKGILSDFLEKHYKEVCDMLAWECTIEDELAIKKEEGQEEGIEIGKARGKAEGTEDERLRMAEEMLADGEDINKIIKYSKLSREEVYRMQELVGA